MQRKKQKICYDEFDSLIELLHGVDFYSSLPSSSHQVGKKIMKKIRKPGNHVSVYAIF
jgi:hypothetical protein